MLVNTTKSSSRGSIVRNAPSMNRISDGRAYSRLRQWLSVVAAGTLVGAFAGVVMVGGGSIPATAAITEAVGCGANNTATATDLQAFQQDIVTLDGAGGGTITLAADCTYSFVTAYTTGPLASWYGPEALPAIAAPITIVGQGAVIQRDPSATDDFRLFFIGADPTNANTFGYTTPGAGNLTLQDLTLNNGVARGGDGSDVQAEAGGGGMGGAIFNQGELTLNRATIMGSTAQGGNGSGLGGPGASGGQSGGIGPGTGFSAGFNVTGSAGGAGGSAGQAGNQAGSGGGGGGFRSPSDNGFNGGNSGPGGAAGSVAAQTGSGGTGGAVPGASGGASGDGSGGGGAAPGSSEILRAGGSGGNAGGFGYGGAGGSIGSGVADSPWSPGGGGGGGGVGGGGGGGGAGESGTGVDGNTGGAGGAGGGGGFGGGGGSGGPGGQGTGDQSPLGSGFNGGNGGNGGAGGFGGGGGGGGAGGDGGVGATDTGSPGTAGGGAPGGFGAGAGTGGAFNFAGGGGGGAGMGGALFNDQGQVTLDNATLSDNTAQGGLGGGHGSIICCAGADGHGLGGAVFNLNGTITTDSATIAFNTADNGGGIYNLGYSGADGAHSYAAGVTLVNSIVARDTDPGGGSVTDVVSDAPATVSNGTTNIASSNVNVGGGTPSHNIVMSSSTLGGATITGTAPITTDPWDQNVTLSANIPSSPTPPFTPPDTLAIDQSSPAYNTGSTALDPEGASITTDERGVARPALGQDDIGAFEFTLITPTLTVQSQATAGLGDEIEAQANLSGGSNFDGTVTFDLYGPNDSACTGTPFFSEESNVNNNAQGAQSIAFTSNPFTAFGTYSWQATYSGGLFYFGTTSRCGASNVVVGAATTTLSAEAVSTINAPLSGALFGVPFEDSAAVAGFGTPSGTMTFKLYGPTDPTCTGSPVFTDTEPFNGSVQSKTFSASASVAGAGTYHWIASYGGDANNKPVSGACGDAGQTVTVTSAPSLVLEAIPTQAGPADSLSADATLIGGVDNPTGTVTFKLYQPGSSGPGSTECVDNPLFTVTVPLSSLDTAASGSFVPENALGNPTIFPLQGTYTWTARYSGDANNPASVPTTCGATTVVVGKETPTMTAQATPAQAVPEQGVSDTVTFTNVVDQFADVTFKLWNNATCTGTPVAQSETNIAEGSYDPSTGQITVNSATDTGVARVGAGTYYWTVSYPGDTDDNAVNTTCGAAGQTLTVTKPTPSLTISQFIPSQVVVGNPVQAQATLGGGSTTGIVFFDVYGPVSPGTACNASSLPGIQAFLFTIDGNSDGNGNVDGDGVYTSDVFTPTAPGTYFWEVHYTPSNTIDNSADEVCGPHGSLTVTSGGTTAQSITASASPTSTSPANTSTVSSSGYSGTGAITYALDQGTNGNTSDPTCQLSGTAVSATEVGTCYVETTIAADTTYQAATSADVAVTFTNAVTDTITFNSEGGSAVDPVSGTDGTTITLPGAPTLAGSTFDGWFAGPSGGTALTSPYTLAGSVTLYAQWTSNPTDTVLFNSEGGSAVDPVSGPDGTTITLPGAPTLAGSTFDGWFAAPSGGAALTSPYTLAGSVTLYAQWTPNTDTITFNSEGGSAVDPVSGPDGTTITLPGAPTLAGSIFDGWFAAPSGGTPLTSPYTLAGSVTLYAQWSQIGTDTVLFNSEGGSAVDSMSGLDGSTITLPAAPTLPGSTFDGWFTSPSGGTALTSPYTLAGSTTLYAQWTTNPTDTITFNSEGGSAVNPVSGPDGSTITLPAAPTLAGSTFDGWFTAPSGGAALTSPYTLAGSVTLYAQWSPLSNVAQTIAFKKPANKTLAQSPVTLSATASSGLAVTFTSRTPSICSTGGPNGATLTLRKAGTCTIAASQAGNATYAGAPGVVQSFTVTKASQKITFTKPPNRSRSQAPVTLNATASSGLAVTLTSFTPTICSIGGRNGATLTLHRIGTCIIAASQAGNATYAAAPGVLQTFTVSK